MIPTFYFYDIELLNLFRMVDEEMYLMKTMCLAKKTVQMPTKEEHGFLLFCGLGIPIISIITQ